MLEINARDIPYPTDATAGEHVLSGELRWSVSWRENGVAVEEDGLGVAPPKVRALLLAQHGEWRVQVEDRATRSKVMRALRSMFGLTLLQASAATTAMPGDVYRGTIGEATLLANRLKGDGVPATLVGP